MNYSIGIGITTTPNRSNYFRQCLDNMMLHTENVCKLYTHVDEFGKGVAYSKNECLYNLRDCDFIFLFDDDCWPIMKGWETDLIKAHITSGEKHFLFLDERTHGKRKPIGVGYSSFENCGGVFMSFDNRNVLIENEVGYMDYEYKRWGFEHAGYSQRIYRANLTSSPYIMPNFLPSYLYAVDYDPQIKAVSSLTNEEKSANFEHNRQIFVSECTNSPIYKPYRK